MCYAIPGKVVAINNKRVTVDYFGERRDAHNELDTLKIGDYIYAQGGYAIKAIPTEEAEAILAVWKETFFELQQADLQISRREESGNCSQTILRLLDKAAENRNLREQELHHLGQLSSLEELELLYKTGNFLRCKHQGNGCCVHGIIEFSNYCVRNCHYCGIAKNNSSLSRYRLSVSQVVAIAQEAIETYGFKALVLQSGEDPDYPISDICNIISTIKKQSPALIIISVGERPIADLKKMYQAGARGILMRFETSNPSLYKKLHPGTTLETRVNYLKKASELGYFLITGGLVGLPGQSMADIVDDIKLTAELGAEMYSFGPFIPHPESPLAKAKVTTSETILKTLAIARLYQPKEARILITTAFETIDKNARRKGLLAGANSLMINATPEKFQEQYALYPNRAHNHISLQEQINNTISILRNLGRAPSDLSIN